MVVLLLDVDGVINAPRPGWDTAPTTATIAAAGRPYRVRWAPQAVARIRSLATSGHVDVRWCTTWCPHADLLEALWKLPPLPRALDPADTSDERTATAAKLAAARAVLDEGRRLVWVDDAAIPAPGTATHRDLTTAGRALLITPNQRRGIRPHHFDAIEHWAAC